MRKNQSKMIGFFISKLFKLQNQMLKFALQ